MKFVRWIRIVVSIIFAIMALTVLYNKAFALCPEYNFPDPNDPTKTITVYLSDWDMTPYELFNTCMEAQVVITQGSEIEPIDAVIMSREHTQLIISIWAAIFFPGCMLIILRAIV
jgi:hypothetical protein